LIPARVGARASFSLWPRRDPPGRLMPATCTYRLEAVREAGPRETTRSLGRHGHLAALRDRPADAAGGPRRYKARQGAVPVSSSACVLVRLPWEGWTHR